MVPFLQVAISVPLMHIGNVLCHTLGGEHVHVCDTQRLEDVLLEVIVQFLPCYSLQDDACPVNSNLFTRQQTSHSNP